MRAKKVLSLVVILKSGVRLLKIKEIKMHIKRGCKNEESSPQSHLANKAMNLTPQNRS